MAVTWPASDRVGKTGQRLLFLSVRPVYSTAAPCPAVCRTVCVCDSMGSFGAGTRGRQAGAAGDPEGARADARTDPVPGGCASGGEDGVDVCDPASSPAAAQPTSPSASSVPTIRKRMALSIAGARYPESVVLRLLSNRCLS